MADIATAAHLRAFPKVFTIGQDYIADLFADDVEVTEKIDGSMFVFGRIDGQFICRSKGREIPEGTADKLFAPAVQYTSSIDLPDDTIFYGETLCRPKHNTLCYERAPRHNVVIFGASTPGLKFVDDYNELTALATSIDLETVPLLYRGKVESTGELAELLATDSFLGGTKIEGVVAKNYARPFLLGGQPIPVMCGKFVSEAFKEKHQKSWSTENTSRGKWEVFASQFCTEARWEKAVQHLRDAGELENAPRDIGKLINEIKRDIAEEEADAIKTFLWREFGSDLLRKSTSGAPEWYKSRLAERAF
jgi:hypothetical protein